jgi:hypothetical protein
MALDFPNAPTLNQIFIGPNNIAWQWDNTKWTQVGVAVSQNTPVMPPGGRLTLTSGVPVMTVDVAAATTIYYTPYNGNNIPIYNGTVFVPYAFAELSLALNTTAHVAATLYDLFVWNNAGTLQLVSGPAWSSQTARSAALALVNGVQTNAASMAGIASGNTSVTVPANQGTYVGTFRTNSSIAGQTLAVAAPAAASGGSAPQWFLWNMYNRRLVKLLSYDNGANYTYATAAWRIARASSVNAAYFITGLAEDAIAAISAFDTATSPATIGAYAQFGHGLDSVASSDGLMLVQTPAAYTMAFMPIASSIFPPQIGQHSIARMEYAAVGTWTMSLGWLTVSLWC